MRTGQISNDQAVEVEQSLAAVAGEVTKERDELIGPTLGEELRTKALIAFGIAVGAQMLYLAFRFRWTYAAAAVLSMAHVVLTVVGIFAWLGKPVDGVFLAAVLSIIGLAVNDTIVVFDRIRERTRAVEAGGLREEVNLAILQTVPRTVNTGLGAMFILAALAVLGGDSLTDFAVALLLGLTIGIYSTIFTASPLAIWAEERWPPVERTRGGHGRRPVRRGAGRRTRERPRVTRSDQRVGGLQPHRQGVQAVDDRVAAVGQPVAWPPARSGSRRASAGNAARSSIRASSAPTHRWKPCPNARCEVAPARRRRTPRARGRCGRRGWRRRGGRSRCRPSRSARPPTSTSCRGIRGKDDLDDGEVAQQLLDRAVHHRRVLGRRRGSRRGGPAARRCPARACWRWSPGRR